MRQVLLGDSQELRGRGKPRVRGPAPAPGTAQASVRETKEPEGDVPGPTRPPPPSQLTCVRQLQSSRVGLPQDTGRGQGRPAQRQTGLALGGDPSRVPPHQLALCRGASCAEGCEQLPGLSAHQLL